MASSHNSSDYVEELVEQHSGEYDVLAKEQGFPGILVEDEGANNYDGEVDLLLWNSQDREKMMAYELKETSSLSQRTIVGYGMDAREQLDNAREHLEEFGYEVETEYVIRPEGKLRAAYEVWENFGESFEPSEALEEVSDSRDLNRVIEKGAEKRDGEFVLDEEIVAVFESGLVQL
jgi:hypothetical protein